MSFVAQWNEIERRLPENWAEARLVATIDDDDDCDRAAALLGPANPARRLEVIRFFTARRGAGVGPEAVRRLLRRLDAEGIEGRLELVGAGETETAPEVARRALADQWEAAVATLPEDWSDLVAVVEIGSTDWLERAALLLSPLNPLRTDDRPGLRFRAARRFGYGASPAMARRCFARLDEEGIPGELEVLRVLSDTKPVATQGPVWYVGGKTV